MDICSNLWKDTLHHLQQGLPLVTASKRQADFLHQVYREQQSILYKSKVWKRANIFTWTEWVDNQLESLLMHSGNTAPARLSKAHCLYLWQQIIESDDDPLLNVPLAARKAYRAAEILNEWQQTASLDDDVEYNDRMETIQFRRWYQQIHDYCESSNLVPPYRSQGNLLALLKSSESNQLVIAETIMLHGFQQLTPIQEAIFSQLEHRGIKLIQSHPGSISATETRLEFKDINTELKHCALWAKQQYDKDPTARLAIIVPELEQHRENLRRYFSKVFQRDYWLSAAHVPTRPFDISLAQPLASYPLVNDLLLVLQLARGQIKYFELIHLVQSTYLSHELNNTRLVPLILQIKVCRREEFKRSHLEREVLDQINPDHREQLAFLDDMIQSQDALNTTDRLKPSGWVEQLLQLMRSIDFAPESKLDSDDYQTKAALFKVLEVISTFDVVIDSLNWFDWLTLLKQQLNQRLFQPQTGHCPIQIMGIFEASSLSFDKVRMVSVDNSLWPAKTSPNPFLPYRMQKLLNMPNANPERELELCLTQYQSLKNHSRQIVFSHVNDTLEEGHKVSPIIESLPLSSTDITSSVESLQQDIQHIGQDLTRERIEDDYATRIDSNDIKGGSSLLKDMAMCPFRAFVHHRLRTREPDAPKNDLDAMDKGNILHHLLETIWRDLLDNSSEVLIQKLSSAGLEQQIRNLVTDELLDFNLQNGKRYSTQSLSLECKRLVRLIMAWLEFESNRPPFTVVERERRHQYPIGEQSINVFIDRIDRLEDGTHAVIDYKTGIVQAKEWFGERPTEPQMPLYACVLDNENKDVSAVAYAQVRFQEYKYTGISDKAGELQGIRSSFEKHKYESEATTIADQIPIWRDELNSLMQQYIDGYAAIDPKGDTTCNYCDLKGICRIAEIYERPELETSSKVKVHD